MASRSRQLPNGFSEQFAGGTTKLRWAAWPPIAAGFIIVPWIIGWSFFTPFVWHSFFTQTGTHAANEGPSSLGDALGFSFFWIFGFSLFSYLYLRVDQFQFDAKQFERKNGSCFLFYKTSSAFSSIDKVVHRTKDIQYESGTKTIDYLTLEGMLNQVLVFDCYFFQLPLRHKDCRAYEMLLNDRDLANFIWRRFQCFPRIAMEFFDANDQLG
ncbi:hypothetical protein SH528x_003577 [Novipirellula sp. SH528]|uniref:hypothetical protein n=1 Tax=Novipirellula sp. SH528 TaxID=3454466 RepID=UPI003F9F7B29